MNDEELIRTLRNCVSPLNGKCRTCVFKDTGYPECCELLIGEAADRIEELMEAPEPHVLTLEEVLRMGDKLMWLEYKTATTPEVPVIYPTSPYNDNDTYPFTVSFQSSHVKSRAFYGKQWRCWSEKPTEEKRMKEKWDG